MLTSDSIVIKREELEIIAQALLDACIKLSQVGKECILQDRVFQWVKKKLKESSNSFEKKEVVR